jgi:hypothetical protein
MLNIYKEARRIMVAVQGAKVALEEVEKGRGTSLYRNGTHAPPPKASSTGNLRGKEMNL